MSLPTDGTVRGHNSCFLCELVVNSASSKHTWLHNKQMCVLSFREANLYHVVYLFLLTFKTP